MPNIVSHLLITKTAIPEASPDILLGSVLPDFMGMYRDYRGGNLRSPDFVDFPDIQEGIRVHQQTDMIYDGLKLRQESLSQLRKGLEEIQPALPRAAIRACTDAGNDILLDGVLMNNVRSTKVLLDSFSQKVMLGSTSLGNFDNQEFAGMIEDHFYEKISSKYANPEIVATMLYFRFINRKRQRLAFSEDSIEDVARVFGEHQPRLAKISKLLIKQTVDGLKQSGLPLPLEPVSGSISAA